MLSRVLAVWLVTLILLPFSPPFSTCDASSFFASDEQYDETSGANSALGSLTDAGASQALPVGRVRGRARSVVLAANEPAGIVVLHVRPLTPGHAVTRSLLPAHLAAPLRI